MKIENRMQVKSWKQKMVLLAGVLCLALMANAPARAEPDVPFVVDAIIKAKEAPTGEGRWVVTATVVFTSKNSPTMTATGPVGFAGIPADGFIKGIIPMTIGDDAETGKINALGVVVKRDGTVGIQWRIADKPFLGRQPLVFTPTAFSDYLSKGINFGGAFRRMKLTLTSEWVKPPKIRVPGKKPPRIRVPGSEEKKEPIGKRYKIIGRAVITNSEDGIGDNTVEALGGVTIKYRVNGVLTEKEVIPYDKYKRGTNGVIPFEELYVDLIFADPRLIQVVGSFEDADNSSANDGMWTGKRSYNLEKSAAKGETVMPGDRDSENIEVYFTVTAAGDIF